MYGTYHQKGEPKIVSQLTYPITGEQCVNRIYTDLCIIQLENGQAKVIEIVDGLSFDQLQAMTGCPLVDARQ